jgi:glycosyltransferase involved in cell wall biosynthesis
VSPAVTIITPTFNREDLLPQTLDSILSQPFQDLEYVLVDDGSTDGTAELIRQRYPQVHYLHHPNQGESVSVNRGWAQARGRYVAVVSSDDPMLPGWLEESVAFMDAHPDVLVCYPDWQVIDANSATVYPVTTMEYRRDALVGWLHTLPGPGALIRRAPLAGLAMLRDPRYRFIPDLDCWLRLSLVGPFARVPHQLATWRQHAGSLTVAGRSRRQAQEFIDLATAFFARPDLPADLHGLRATALSRAHWYASWVLRDVEPLRSAWHLRRSHAVMADDPPGLPAHMRRSPCPSWMELGAHWWRSQRQRTSP